MTKVTIVLILDETREPVDKEVIDTTIKHAGFMLNPATWDGVSPEYIDSITIEEVR